VGVDNRHWTAYGLFDTYHDGGESRHDVRSYQATQGVAALDPLTCGRRMVDSSISDARDYFLRVMESCVEEVTEEWENSVQQVLKALKTPVSSSPLASCFLTAPKLISVQARNVNDRRAQRITESTLQTLEELIQGLDGTSSAWERLKETDLAYFDPDNAPTGTPSPIRNIEASMHKLRALRSSMLHHTTDLRTLIARVSPIIVSPHLPPVFTPPSTPTHHHHHQSPNSST
jgi:uncharacterized protein (DUF2267 family)